MGEVSIEVSARGSSRGIGVEASSPPIADILSRPLVVDGRPQRYLGPIECAQDVCVELRSIEPVFWPHGVMQQQS